MQGLRAMLQFERMERRHREIPIKVVGVVPNMVNISTSLHRENIRILLEDPLIGPLMTNFYVAKRIAFPTMDKPGISPKTIWEFGDNPEAKKDAYQLCSFVEERLFENRTESEYGTNEYGQAVGE